VQSVLATARLQRGRFLVFATRGGIVKRPSSAPTTRPINADGHHRDQDSRGRRPGRRSAGPAATDDILVVARSRSGGAFHESQMPSGWPRHLGDEGDERGAGRQPGARDGRRERTIRSCLSVTRTATASEPRLSDYPRKGRGTMGVKDDHLDREQGGPLAGRSWSRARGAAVHQRRGHGPAATPVRGINRFRPRLAGVRLMNPQGRRHCQRGKPLGRRIRWMTRMRGGNHRAGRAQRPCRSRRPTGHVDEQGDVE